MARLSFQAPTTTAAVPGATLFHSPQSIPPGWGTCTYPDPIQGGRAISYRYDPLERLTEAAYSGGECYQLRYDAAGNRTAMRDPAGEHSYTYDAASRLTGVDGVGYSWDERGNQTGNGTCTYDGASRLGGVQGAGQTLAYTYDGDGLRVARTAAGQVTAYTWDLAAALPQQLNDGSALYLSGVGRWDGQEWTYSLPDGLGSVRQLAGEQAHVLQRYDYSPFGRVVSAEGERENPLRYTGEHWDAGAGLLYLRARWYEPAIGRFLTRDPFPGLALLPQTQHDYVYVGNNPVNFTDPSGEFVFIPLLLVAAACQAEHECTLFLTLPNTTRQRSESQHIAPQCRALANSLLYDNFPTRGGLTMPRSCAIMVQRRGAMVRLCHEEGEREHERTKTGREISGREGAKRERREGSGRKLGRKMAA